MSTPPNDMQTLLSQLQQSGILSDASPGMDSGLLGKATAAYGGPANLGMTLLANSGPSAIPRSFGQIVGQSALQAQQVAQQSQDNTLKRQLMRMELAQGAVGLGTTLQRQQALQQLFGGGQSGQSQGGMPTQAPQPSVPPPMLQAPGNGYDPTNPATAAANQPPPQPDPTGSVSQSMNPQEIDAYSKYALLSPNANPLDILQTRQKLQLEAAQRAVAPKLAQFDNVVKSDAPTRDVRANAQLMQTWTQIAPQFGIDPVKGFTDSGVRTVFGMAGNQIRAGAGMPSVAPPLPLKTVQLPDGRTAQIDPLTGKESIESASSLEKVLGPNGKPTLVPTGKAAGMTPYNQLSTATDDDLQSAADQVAHYQIAPPTGRNLLSGNWPAVMKLVKQINPDYDATQFAAKNKARMSFATGKQGDITRSLSVATDHLDQLSTAALALKNGGLPAANSVANFFSKQTGNPSVTNFNAMKEIVGDEVVKAVVGTGGAAGDREAIKQSFNAANSPDQLLGVIAKYKGLMGGQLSGLRRQYEKSTGLKDFNDMVSSNAQSELGGNSGAAVHPPAIQSLLDKYK